MKSIVKRIKNQLLTGIIVIMPVGLTVWIVWVLFTLIGNRFLPIFRNIRALSVLPLPAQMAISAFLTMLVIWFIGLWAKNYIGKKMIKWFESLVLKTPIINKIYKTIRQLIDSMFVNKKAFKEVAVIEYPRKGLYTIVFVTNEFSVDDNKRMVSVFIPSTPNPTTGYCIILPKEDLNMLNIGVNEAMEFIFSGGILVPEGLSFPGNS
ncbi:DUF502 domain-containing protein [Elusimicrobiota bacterium]